MAMRALTRSGRGRLQHVSCIYRLIGCLLGLSAWICAKRARLVISLKLACSAIRRGYIDSQRFPPTSSYINLVEYEDFSKIARR